MPTAFWVFSIGGGLMLLGYALYRKDPVFIIGQAFGVFVYLRNLQFVMRSGGQGARGVDLFRARAIAAKPRSRSAIRSSGIFQADVKAQRRAARRPLGRGAIFGAVEQDHQALEAAPREAHAEQRQLVHEGVHGFFAGIGLSTMLNSPQAPVKSRFQIAWPGSLSSAGCSTRSTSGRCSSQRATRQARLVVARQPHAERAQAAQRQIHVVGPDAQAHACRPCP